MTIEREARAAGGAAAAKLPLRLIVLLALAYACFYGARLCLTLYAVFLHASPLAVGMLMSAMMVMPVFLSVPAGRWADRTGFRGPAACGLAVLCLGTALPAMHASIPVLALASVCIGSGFIIVMVSINNAIGHASTAATRARAFGTTALGFALATMTGPLVAGFLIDHFGHRLAFLGMMLFAVASCGLLALHAPSGGEAAAVRPAASRKVGDLLRPGILRSVLILSGLASVGWDLFSFLVPLYAAKSGLSASVVGLVMSAFGAGSVVVRIGVGSLVRVLGEWHLLCGSLMLTALCYMALPFLFPFIGLLLSVSFVLGVAVGCGQPVSMSLVHRESPEGRSGEAVGVRSTINSACHVALPLVFGALGAVVGAVPVFCAAGTLLGSGAAFHWRRKP